MGEFSLVRPFGPPIGLFPMPLDLVLALNSWVDEQLDLEVLATLTSLLNWLVRYFQN